MDSFSLSECAIGVFGFVNSEFRKLVINSVYGNYPSTLRCICSVIIISIPANRLIVFYSCYDFKGFFRNPFVDGNGSINTLFKDVKCVIIFTIYINIVVCIGYFIVSIAILNKNGGISCVIKSLIFKRGSKCRNCGFMLLVRDILRIVEIVRIESAGSAIIHKALSCYLFCNIKLVYIAVKTDLKYKADGADSFILDT